MTAPVFTQWSTVAPFLGTALPSWVPPVDQQRIGSYLKYEEMYWSSEEGFASVIRGDNDNPIMMPTARTIVNTVNRYTAPGFTFLVEGDDASAVQIARTAFEKLFKRERFLAQFNGAKRKWLVHGDWLWHVIADPNKPLGRRLTVMTVDPGAYFPVYESDVVQGGDPDKIVKVHLAERVLLGSDQLVSRLTYTKIVDEDEGSTTITRSHGLFKLDKWWSSLQPVRIILPEETLPEEITAIPVYHLRNYDETMPFGSSEMRGLEGALLGINQTMSDEDAALSLEGLGVYATDGGAPIDENGKEVDWIISGGRVITNANGLRRIAGVSSVAPFGDHYARLLEAVRMAVGASDAAVGKIDAATAESGIALLFQLGPIMSYTAEKDQTIIDVHAQMFYDLCAFLQVYEDLPLLTNDEMGNTVPNVVITPIVGSKIPANIKEIIERIVALRNLIPPAISLSTAHRWLADAGVVLQDNELALIQQEQEGVLSAIDATAAQDQDDEDRAAEELELT